MKKVITATVGAALISGALLGAGAANADDADYAQILNETRPTPYKLWSVAEARWIGTNLCHTMEPRPDPRYNITPYKLARALYSSGRRSWEQVEREVQGAVENYCPQHG